MYFSDFHKYRLLLIAGIILLLFFTCISLPDSVFAQRQSNDEQTDRIQILNEIQDANNNYYDRKYAEAIIAYQELLKKDLQQNQKNSMRLMLGQTYAKIGEDVQARILFITLINENPDGSYATQAVHQLSNLYSQRYQYAEALLQCKQILKQHPNSSAGAIAAYLTAYYQYIGGKFDEAMDGYKFFLDTYPNSIYRSAAVGNLVRLYTQNERFSDAEKLIKDRMKLNPTDTNLLEHLASLYQQQEKYQEALELFKGVLEQNPTNTSIHRKIGSLYLELGEKDKAISQWRKMVTGQSDQHQQMGSIFLTHKLYPEAIDSFHKAISANRNYGYLYTQLAAAYKIQGNIEKAFEIYLEGLKNVGQSISQREAIWEVMIEIYVGKNQKPLREEMISKLHTAHQTNPKDIPIALTLSELQFYSGEHNDSLNTLISMYHGNPHAIDAILERFADILNRNQDLSAIDFYKKLLQNSRNIQLKNSNRIKLAKFYKNNEMWMEAANLLDKSDFTSPGSIDSRLLLSQIQLHGLYNPKAAQITLQPILTQRLMSNQLIDSQLILAECHILLKRYTLAREILTPIANSMDKSNTPARKLIGDSYFYATEFDNALTEYRKVIQSSKSDLLTNDALERIVLIQDNQDYLTIPLTDYANALQLFLSGDTKAAITQCEDTISLHPKALIIDDLWMLLGLVHRSQNAYGDALHSYRQIVSQKGLLSVKALTQIAAIYEHKNDLKNARDTYTTLLTTYPDNSVVPFARQQLDALTKLIRNNDSNFP